MPTADEEVCRVLGVSPDASAEVVKTAYRAIAHANHPDRRPGDGAAAERFAEASRAYTRWMQANGFMPLQATPAASSGVGNLDDVFAQFGDLFGEFFGHHLKGADLRVTLQLSEEDARLGCKRDVSVTRGRVCSECGGAGGSGEQTACKDCSGSGKRNTKQGFFMVQTSCATCGGSAKHWRKPCRACEHGLVRSLETFSVSVPPGVQHGQRLRIPERGNEAAGKPTGHLFIEILLEGHVDASTPPPLGVPRDRGHDVVVDVAVRARHLLIGGPLEVPTPDGSATVKVPRNIEDGHEIRLAGRGRPRATQATEGGDPYRDVGKGDLVVVLRVPPAVRKQREVLGFSVMVSIVLAILVALSMR